MSPCDCLDKDAVLALAQGALTYRQLNYWTANGIITAHRHSQRGTERTLHNRLPLTDGGSGTPCGWDPAEARRTVWIAEVCRATGMLPHRAATLHDTGSITIDTITGPLVLRRAA